MNENHPQHNRHEYDDLTRLEQAIRDKQPTGNRTIDRLVSTVPRPDASRRDALEAYLVAQLSPESEQKESAYMDMPVEMKRKNKPKPRRRGRNIGIAAVVTVVLAFFGWMFMPREFSVIVNGPGFSAPDYSGVFLTPENTNELDPMMLTATVIVADATRFAVNAMPNSAGLGDDQMTATALIQEVTQVYVDQTAQASGLSREMLTATAIIRQATQIVSDATAQAIFSNQSLSGDQATATALILEVTQVYVDQTATMQRILGTPVPLATPTPEPNLSGVGLTIQIPITRFVPYDNRTVTLATFTANKRLVLLTELSLTQYASIVGEVESNDAELIERPIIATSARIVDVHQAQIGDIALIEVQVDASEYAVLKWFVDSTNVQFLFIASR